MKIFHALILTIFFSELLLSNVVINEVLYDPVGSDNGYEWIEIYNNGDKNINLKGWKIQKAGSTFETCFTFDSNIILHPQNFLLIGENKIINADIITSLGFQNGGSATDGIRLISPDSLYTDTILYDSPNTNNLPDDNHNIPENCFNDVAQGHSIARIVNGKDTNSFDDWFDCENPTPKKSNIPPVDLSIENFYKELNNDKLELFATIKNLSTINVDNFEANITFFMNNQPINTQQIPYISLDDSLVITTLIDPINSGYHIFMVNINSLQDNNLHNNADSLSILIGISPIILNEIMIKPTNDDNEWIEIFNRSGVDNFVDNLFIKDRTSGKITLFGPITDYLVICKNKELFFNSFPFAEKAKVIQSPTWTSLNNTTENLYLIDSYGTILDTLYYSAYHLPENISYERVNPFTDNNIEWYSCINENGATPTFPNSNLPLDKNLTIKFISLSVNDNKILHHLAIYNNGINNITNVKINCFVKKDDDNFELIYDSDLSLEDSLNFSLETNRLKEGYYTFKYQIFSEEDLSSNDNEVYSFYNDNSLPFVINEIMYDPFENEPEWLEIYKNYHLSELDSFYLKVGDDLYKHPMSEDNYIIITSSHEDAQFLYGKYNLNKIPLVGMSSLANTGKILYLYDKDFNLIESFTYNPQWNNKQKGTSIERINPTIIAEDSNFGPCINISTPEKENSLYVQVIPTQMKFTINPNPFSPIKSENTIIQYNLPTPISRINITIYDLKGRKVKRISKNSLSSSKGKIIWDGKNDKNKILPTGVYIVHFKAISTQNNKIFKKNKTVVIKR